MFVVEVGRGVLKKQTKTKHVTVPTLKNLKVFGIDTQTIAPKSFNYGIFEYHNSIISTLRVTTITANSVLTDDNSSPIHQKFSFSIFLILTFSHKYQETYSWRVHVKRTRIKKEESQNLDISRGKKYFECSLMGEKLNVALIQKLLNV